MNEVFSLKSGQPPAKHTLRAESLGRRLNQINGFCYFFPRILFEMKTSIRTLYPKI